MPRLLILVSLAAALGCVAIPLEGKPTRYCGRGGTPCQTRLVLGLFPAIGEAHMNDLATNGKPITLGLWLADYTLRPLYIAGINALSLGVPTATSWLLEPYENWDTDFGRCGMALLGYCKSAKLMPPDERARRR